MVAGEKKVSVLVIGDEKDLGDTISNIYRNIYFYKESEQKPYIGAFLKHAFVYMREDGIHRVYVKSVTGIKYLFVDDKFLIPIPGSLDTVLSTDTNIALSVRETDTTKALLVLKGKDVVFEFRSISKGFLSKKKYLLKDVDLGMSGKTLFGIGEIEGDGDKRKVLITGSNSGYSVREYKTLIPWGWNGLWYMYLEPGKGNVNIYSYLANNNTKKYSVPLDLVGRAFLKPHSVFYYDPFNDIVGLNSGSEVKILDLKNKRIQWQKVFGVEVDTPVHGPVYDRIALFLNNKAYVVNIENGTIVFEQEYRDKVVSATLSENYLVVATTDRLYIYSRRKDYFEEFGKYVVFGSIIGLNACEDDLLVVYKTLGGIIKALYINLKEKMDIAFKKVSLVTNTGIELPIGDFKWDVRVLEKNSPYLDIVKRGNKLALIDRGSDPGDYRVSFLLSTPRHLPAICDLDVKVEGIRSIIRKIKIMSKPVYGELGAYIPLTIETSAEIDELYAILTSRDNSVFASTNLIHGLDKGEKTIPLYISWAKAGVHDVELKVIGWNRRNRLYERFSASIKFDRDIPPLYSRIHGDTLLLWSPYDIGNVEVRIRSGRAETTLVTNISRGWNELEAPATPPEEIVIYLPTKVRCIIRRGKSWIEFLK